VSTSPCRRPISTASRAWRAVVAASGDILCGASGTAEVALLAVQGVGAAATFEARSDLVEPVKGVGQALESGSRFVPPNRGVEMRARAPVQSPRASASLPGATATCQADRFHDLITSPSQGEIGILRARGNAAADIAEVPIGGLLKQLRYRRVITITGIPDQDPGIGRSHGRCRATRCHRA
jgi:hypothetical protein